jgi:hypothetical protein
LEIAFVFFPLAYITEIWRCLLRVSLFFSSYFAIGRANKSQSLKSLR